MKVKWMNRMTWRGVELAREQQMGRDKNDRHFRHWLLAVICSKIMIYHATLNYKAAQRIPGALFGTWRKNSHKIKQVMHKYQNYQYFNKIKRIQSIYIAKTSLHFLQFTIQLEIGLIIFSLPPNLLTPFSSSTF